MTQPTVEQGLRPAQYDAEATLKATDALLGGMEKRSAYSPEHWEREYSECCGNARHSEQLRASIMGFWASFNGILFVAVGVALNLLDRRPAVSFGFLMAIGIAGSFITAMVGAMETREMDYYAQFCQRCRILESQAGFYGQYWRTYINLVKNDGKKSRVGTMKRMYLTGIVCWLLLSVVSSIALLLNFTSLQRLLRQ